MDDGTPYLRRVSELEAERGSLIDSLNAAKARATQLASAAKIGPAQIRAMLTAMRIDLAKKSDAGRVSEARAAIAEIVDRIEYQEGADAFTIRYRIGGVNLASPRGSVTIPTIVARTLVRVA